MLRQHMKRLGLQRIADQECGCFVKLDVAGRFAATQDVVVHAGHVVMHQRIGVDHFYGNRRRVEHAAVGTENRPGRMA